VVVAAKGGIGKSSAEKLGLIVMREVLLLPLVTRAVDEKGEQMRGGEVTVTGTGSSRSTAETGGGTNGSAEMVLGTEVTGVTGAMTGTGTGSGTAAGTEAENGSGTGGPGTGLGLVTGTAGTGSGSSSRAGSRKGSGGSLQAAAVVTSNAVSSSR
jgi:hypothetical protein